MEIFAAATHHLHEVSRIQGFLEKSRLKGQGFRQGDFTFVGTR